MKKEKKALDVALSAKNRKNAMKGQHLRWKKEPRMCLS